MWHSTPASSSTPPPQLAHSLLVFLIVLVLSLLLAPEPRAEAAVVQSVALQLFLVLGVPLVLASLLRSDSRVIFSLCPTSAMNLVWSLVLAIGLICVLDEVAFLQFRLTGISAGVSPEIQRLLRAASISQFLWILFALALVPAVCEEFLFRGFLFGSFQAARGPAQALMLSAVLFGIFHRNLQTLLPTTLAGVALAFIVLRSGSLYNAVIAHAAVNTWAIIVANADVTPYVPWALQPQQIPLGILIISMAGIVLAGKKLTQTH